MSHPLLARRVAAQPQGNRVAVGVAVVAVVAVGVAVQIAIKSLLGLILGKIVAVVAVENTLSYALRCEKKERESEKNSEG